MMSASSTWGRLAVTAAWLAIAAGAAPAADSSKLNASFGTIAGIVTNSVGTPQMGAAIALIARDGRVLHQGLTNDRGGFQLERIIPGQYSLRVSLTSFLPALRENVLIEPGLRSFLSINLASLFDAMDILRGRRVMPPSDDDWTWVVRNSGGLRPSLRYRDVTDPGTTPRRGVFSSEANEAVLSFNGGAGRSSSAGSEADFNTSFTVANTAFHHTNLMLSGNVGYDRQTPAAAFRGAIRRELPNGSSPEISVTLRQVFLPSAFFGRGGLREERMQGMTLGVEDHLQVAGNARLEYGFLYETIDFGQKLDSFSPYGRLIFDAGPATWRLFYTEGAPMERLPGGGQLSQVASQLAVFPRLSMLNGSPAIQRGRHFEVSAERKLGEQTKVEAGVYRDELTNLALNAAVNPEPAPRDFLPDVFTSQHSFNSGDYHTSGFRAALQHKWTDRLETVVAYGYGGVLSPERTELMTSDPNELRSILRMNRTHALSVKLAAHVPVLGTRFFGGYKWVMRPAVSLGDLYDEGLAQSEPHLNILIRQPLPQMVILPGRVEALADFRNLLAQGYVPITSADGRRILMVQNARSFRGGFNFVF